MRAASYVLPLKWGDDADEAELSELTDYLRALSGQVAEVVVVDGSAPERYARHAAAWSPYVRHLPPDPRLRFANGKVNGVVTGLATASHELVVLADDDVRYYPPALDRVLDLLRRVDLVRPQNVFDAFPWHARWDSARSLLNRAWRADYPGTFGVRRSRFLQAGGYDGDVLFENLEMVRTLKAYGAVEARPLDLYVVRRAPRAERFWDQRPRQAYDDFAQPGRLALELAVLPALAVARTRPAALALGVAALVGAAEAGRRRAGGSAVYPADVPMFAPLWALERGACVWLALWARARHGGARYAGRRLRTAAHSERELRRRAAAGSAAVGWLRELAPVPPGPGGGIDEWGISDGGAEAGRPVGAVAERLDARRPAAAQRDRTPAHLDLGAVGGEQPEGPAHEQRTVLVRRHRGDVLARLSTLPHTSRPAR